MARTVRKVSMYTLMALLLSVIVLMVVLSVVSYDRATNAQAQAQVLRNLSSRVHSRRSARLLFLQKQLSALQGATLSFADEAPKGASGAASLRAARQTLGCAGSALLTSMARPCATTESALTFRNRPARSVRLRAKACCATGEIDGQPCILVAAPAGEGALLGCLDETASAASCSPTGATSACCARTAASSPPPRAARWRICAARICFAALEMDESAAEAIRAAATTRAAWKPPLAASYATWTTLEDANGWQLVTLGAPKTRSWGNSPS